MSIKGAHLSGQIRDVQRISQGKDRIIESGEYLGSGADAHLTMIPVQGDITLLKPVYTLSRSSTRCGLSPFAGKKVRVQN